MLARVVRVTAIAQAEPYSFAVLCGEDLHTAETTARKAIDVAIALAKETGASVELAADVVAELHGKLE